MSWGVAQLAERPAVSREVVGSTPTAPAFAVLSSSSFSAGHLASQLVAPPAATRKVAPFAGADAEWDAAIRALPDGTHCHLSAWREVIGTTLGHAVELWAAYDDEGLPTAFLPLGDVRSRLFGRYLISMPFLNMGGAIGDAPGRAALENHARDLASQRRAKLLELRGREPSPGVLQTSARKITVELPLPEVLEGVRKGFHPKLRTNIKKATREGLEMRYGPDQVDGFYEVFACNMRDLGTPVLPRAFFEQIAARLGGVVHFGALYDRDRPVAGQCAFAFGSRFEMVWGSALREYHRLKVSSHIHWAFIERAHALGCRLFDFGRCTEGSGTHQFKQQWGGADVPLPWGQWSPSGAGGPPSPDRPLFRAAVAVWQRLPLGVANSLGPLVSRSLP